MPSTVLTPPSSKPSPKNRLWDILWILSIGLVCLISFHRQEIFSGLTSLPGDKGDSRLITYLYEHLWQTFRGKAELFSPGMFFPKKGTLGYSDAFIGFAPIYSLFRALGFAPYPALSLNLISWDLLGYLATTFLILRVFRVRALAAAIGSALFIFSSAKLNQCNHLQLQTLAYPPLILLSLFSIYDQRDRLTERGLFLRLSAAALLLDLQLVSSYYMAWFVVFWLFLFLTAWGWQEGVKATTRALAAYVAKNRSAFAGAIGVFALGLSLFLRIYLPAFQEFGPRGYGETFRQIPEVLSFFRMGPQHWAWGWLDPLLFQIRAIPFEWEHRVGMGLVLSLFWILATRAAFRLARGKKLSAPWQNFFSPKTVSPTFLRSLILCTSLFILIGLKYAPRTSPWAAVFYLFPGANAVRAVARYVLFLLLPISAVFAAWLDQRASKSRWIWALATFALLEQQGSFHGFDAAADWKRLELLASTLPKDCPSFLVRQKPNSSFEEFEAHLDAMLVSTITGIPTLNGYTGQQPDHWEIYPKNPQAPQQAQDWLISQNQLHTPCELWTQ